MTAMRKSEEPEVIPLTRDPHEHFQIQEMLSKCSNSNFVKIVEIDGKCFFFTESFVFSYFLLLLSLFFSFLIFFNLF